MSSDFPGGPGPDQEPATDPTRVEPEAPRVESMIQAVPELPEVTLQRELEAALPRELTPEQQAGRPNGTPIFNQPEQAQAYLNLVRRLYRENASSYVGRPGEDQMLAGSIMAESADQIMTGIKQVLTLIGGQDSTETKVGNVEFRQLEQAYGRLCYQVAVLTNRLKNKEPKTDPQTGEVPQPNDYRALGYPEFAAMTDQDQAAVMRELLIDFQDQNALRFGAQGSGNMRQTYIGTPGNRELVEVDMDVARTQTATQNRMERLGYVTPIAINQPHQTTEHSAPSEELLSPAEAGKGNTVHMAGKWATRQVMALRREYSNVPIEFFMEKMGSSRNPRQALEHYLETH